MNDFPLFPLKTVLLPGNRLSLKIFETRYLDMIARCMRENSAFGVVLIHSGEEGQTVSDIYSIGTTATICDWEHRADGLLGISAAGQQRFEIESTWSQDDGLVMANISLLEESALDETPGQYRYMQELLDHVNAQIGQHRESDQGFHEMLYQLIYLLPLEATLKQHLLEIPDCLDRAAILHAELIRLGIIQYIKPSEAS
jgi:Lon protease-like protein